MPQSPPRAPSTEPSSAADDGLSGPAPASDADGPGEAALREAQDLLFFAYRDFTNAADVILEEMGFGRAHHRALHFIGRNPGLVVSDLLSILRITKQSLARVLSALVDQGYVAQSPGEEDRRQRRLTLTEAGLALERRLFDRQRQRLSPAFQDNADAAVDGFRRVMRTIMDETARAYIDRTHRQPAQADPHPPTAGPEADATTAATGDTNG